MKELGNTQNLIFNTQLKSPNRQTSEIEKLAFNNTVITSTTASRIKKHKRLALKLRRVGYMVTAPKIR